MRKDHAIRRWLRGTLRASDRRYSWRKAESLRRIRRDRVAWRGLDRAAQEALPPVSRPDGKRAREERRSPRAVRASGTDRRVRRAREGRFPHASAYDSRMNITARAFLCLTLLAAIALSAQRARDLGVPFDVISPLFEATVQATEEAVINAMVAAETMTGANHRTVIALPHDKLREV